MKVRTALRIKHSEEKQALSYCMSCEIKTIRIITKRRCLDNTEKYDVHVQVFVARLNGPLVSA